MLSAIDNLNFGLTVKKFGRLRKVYRGSITDYCRTITLGSGYIGKWRLTNLCRDCRKTESGNSPTVAPGGAMARGGLTATCSHFEIDTARHLAGPFAAIEDPNVRLVMLLKAAQTAGSLTWDMAIHWMLVHSRFMRIKVYFCDSDEKAARYCNERLMDTLKNNPDIKPLLPTGAFRFENKQAEIKLLNGKHLIVCSLNESTASSLPADVIIIDEAWLAKPGMINKAIARTKQQHGYKIVIVSQAGEKGQDMDTLWNSLHARIPLTWACPECGGRQPFELHKKRPDDFVARPPRASASPDAPQVTSPDLPLWTEPKPGSYVGFKIDGKISELNTPEEIKAACANTRIECYHCGFEIPDTPAMRRMLNDSYEQEYRLRAVDGALYTPPDYTVGFWNPDPASMFVPFRETMEEYVVAFKANKELGNAIPLRDFYLSRWARAWDAADAMNRISERPGANIYDIDPKKKFPGEKCRISGTDIQFKMTHMVYLAVAVGDGTPPWVLHYEWVKPPAGLTDHQAAEHCKARVRALDNEFGIEQQNSMKDSAHEPGLVREWAAEDAVWARPGPGKRPVWFAYGLLLGDDRPSYKWAHPGRKDTWERFKQYQWHKVPTIKDGKRVLVDVHHRLWSNPSIKEIAERWRDGEGAPKLQIHEKFLTATTGREGLWDQLTSERKIPWKGHPGKLHYNNEGRPNHAWDAWCMIVERMDELGYLNSFGSPPEDVETE